jgi:hypothetical protein
MPSSYPDFGLLRWHIRQLFSPMLGDKQVSVLRPSTFGPHSLSFFFKEIWDAELDVRARYTVTNIALYKQPPSGNNLAEHEFLIAEVSRRINSYHSATMYLVVERELTSDAGSEQALSTSPNTSSSISPSDMMECVHYRARATLLARRSATQVASYTFGKFPVVEFLRIVHMVSQHTPKHQLIGAMCFWYNTMIGTIAMTHFGSVGKLRYLTGARRPEVIREGCWREDSQAINEKYAKAREDDPEPLGPRGLEQAALKEETARLKEETARIRERTARREEEIALIKEERALIKEESARIKEETVRIKEEAARVDEEAVERERLQEEIRSLRAQLSLAGANGAQLVSDGGDYTNH